MTWLAGLPPSAQALLLIGLVLVEAVVFYFGYGLLEELIAPAVFDAIRRT
jgi:hypothetical protein